MRHNCRPQQHPSEFSADADVCKVQHGERAIRQHSVQRLEGRVGGPAGHTQADQGDTGDAAHYDTDATDVCAEEQRTTSDGQASRSMPVPASAAAANARTLFFMPSDSFLLLALHLSLDLVFRLLNSLVSHL